VDAAHGKGGQLGAVQKVHVQELSLEGGGWSCGSIRKTIFLIFMKNTFAIFLSLLLSIFLNHSEGGEHGAVQKVHGQELSRWGML
jgi:hypothetical protein